MWEVDIRFLFDAENDLTELEAKELMGKIVKEVCDNNKEIALACIHDNMEKI